MTHTVLKSIAILQSYKINLKNTIPTKYYPIKNSNTHLFELSVYIHTACPRKLGSYLP